MKAKIVTTLAVLATGFITSQVHAHNHLNCNAYAKSVVNQAKKNIGLGCGFSGPVWSTDYNFHFRWCDQKTTQIHHLGEQENIRAAQMQQCIAKVKVKDENRQQMRKDCLYKYAKEAAKLRLEINSACPSDGEWAVPVKQDIDYCMEKGGASYVRIDNIKRIGKIADCELAVKKAKFSQTKRFPDSGKSGVRRKRPLPVDVCLRKYYNDNSWVFGLGGGITNVPPSWGCGKSVADAFCITKGYVEAIKYPIKTYDNGSDMDGRFASTYWIGSKKACHGKCAGFSSITCKGKL